VEKVVAVAVEEKIKYGCWKWKKFDDIAIFILFLRFVTAVSFPLPTALHHIVLEAFITPELIDSYLDLKDALGADDDCLAWLTCRLPSHLNNYKLFITTLFDAACVHGRLPFLKRLVEAKNLLPPYYDIVQRNTNTGVGEECYPLVLACENGHADIARFLHTTFKLGWLDARVQDNRALKHACSRGHLEVVKFLFETFGFTAEQCKRAPSDLVSFGYDSHLAVALNAGHLGVADYLMHRKCVLTRTERQSLLYNTAFCNRPTLDGLKLMFKHGQLFAKDIRRGNCYKLVHAARRGDLEMIKWFVETFGLTRSDVRAYCDDSINAARHAGFQKVVEYLEAV